MSNEFLKHELATVLDGLQQQMRDIAEVGRRRGELTATASVQQRRVTATVDADGILTKLEFADDIDDLTYDEIAAAITEAVRTAATDAARMGVELVRPLRERRAHWPKLSDLLEGALDLPEHVPGESRAPISPPNADERIAATERSDADSPQGRSIVADLD
ncbi:YbaB/EbfC family nucleoid-associated protein [Nocardia arthritidis]|uniref:YbaB/EbfC family DNA-binding protein n=1 Tax=Nocardia arthritidis TaxID=228602 RepID=A0A6G9YAD5_9NOCA|nr:YbaB/EbfC family nucleoid-associated protein [Nocardia arthritidis]QIS10172.1 YbaB/EbfC family DNA-binding protein [Nocardia arthritidis]